MEKLYYIVYSNDWGKGIKNKIENHINCFSKHGFCCEKIILQKNISKTIKYLCRILPFFSEHDYSKLKNVEAGRIIYIRYGRIDFRGLLALMKLHRKSKLIIVEIPTYPYDRESKGLYKILLYKDMIWRHFIKYCIDYIATYSDDKTIYGIQAINISNFVDMDKIRVVFDRKKNNHEIHLIAVATLGFWHGYDRLIEGMNEYYKKEHEYKVYFHMVGHGKELNKYEEMIQKYKLGSYVILYGKKEGKELDEIYDKCDIAIDSLGRHRSGIFYNSTLKGKEYLAKGLPIISGVKTELDEVKDFPYYLRVPSDDTYINVFEIVNFYKNNILKTENLNHMIRKYAECNFNAYKCFLPVIDITKKVK